MPTKSDLLQGTLDLLILKIAALGPIHGYAIAQRIQQVSRDALKVQQGSLYPALYRLEERGYLQAQWRETEQGRMARFYTVTKKGARQLAAECAEWERVAGGITLILQEAARP
jgi:PadR family transcriptional regulator